MIRPDESDTKTTWYYVVVIRITLRTDGTLGGFPWKKRRSLASPIHQSQTILATLIVIVDPNNFSEYSLFFKMFFHVCSPHPIHQSQTILATLILIIDLNIPTLYLQQIFCICLPPIISLSCPSLSNILHPPHSLHAHQPYLIIVIFGRSPHYSGL